MVQYEKNLEEFVNNYVREDVKDIALKRLYQLSEAIYSEGYTEGEGKTGWYHSNYRQHLGEE